MSLLDWLSDGLGLGQAGSIGGGQPPPGMYPGGGEIPMPPVQMTGMDSPSLADPSTQAMPGGQGAGPMPPDPALDAMPSIQGGGAPTPAAPVPIPGQPMNLSPPTDVSAASASPTAGLNSATLTSFMGPGQKSATGSTGILESALGLSPERARQVRASLGAGLKSVGDNWNKPGLAAFSGSAGAGLQGAEKSNDKQTDQRLKVMSASNAAKSAEERADHNRAYLDIQRQRLENEKSGFTSGRRGKGPMSAEEKVFKIQQAVNQDQQIRAARDLLRTAVLPKERQAAQTALDSLVKQKTKELKDQLKPGSRDNPFRPTSQADLKGYKEGQIYINPSDGRLMIYGKPKNSTPTSAVTPSAPAAPGLDLDGGAGATDEDE